MYPSIASARHASVLRSCVSAARRFRQRGVIHFAPPGKRNLLPELQPPSSADSQQNSARFCDGTVELNRAPFYDACLGAQSIRMAATAGVDLYPHGLKAVTGGGPCSGRPGDPCKCYMILQK